MPEDSEAIRSKTRFVGSFFRLVRGIQLRRAGGRWRVATQAAGRDEGSRAHALLEFCLGHRLVELGLLDTEGMDARYNAMEPYIPEEVVGRRGAPRLRIFDALPRMVEMTGIPRAHDPYLVESFEARRIGGADALAPFEPTEIAKSESADPDRFLIARHSRQFVCNEPEIVNVRIARAPGPGHAAKLSRFPIPDGGVEVAVRIDGGEDVEFRSGTAQLVRVMPNSDTEWRGFDVVVKRPGKHPVWITAILDGVEIGRLDIVLEGAEEAGDPSEQETRSTELRNSIGASEDAASIYVQYDLPNKRYTL